MTANNPTTEKIDIIQITDRVRSYDFPQSRTCFIEGVCEGIARRGEEDYLPVGEGGKVEAVCFSDCDRYIIRVERQVFDGAEISIRNAYVFPPVNGSPALFGGPTKGVELINPRPMGEEAKLILAKAIQDAQERRHQASKEDRIYDAAGEDHVIEVLEGLHAQMVAASDAREVN